MKILIVVSNYYQKVADQLCKGATQLLESQSINYEIIQAPGSFEIPYLINNNIDKYDGFVALGCIIRGKTYHFELLANQCARKIIDISIKFNKPIGFGILTCDDIKQAIERSDPSGKNKGKEATHACLLLLQN